MLQNFLIFARIGYMLNKKLIKQINIFDCDLNYIKIPKTRAIDIDDKEDFFLISKILYEKKQNIINFNNKNILITVQMDLLVHI